MIPGVVLEARLMDGRLGNEAAKDKGLSLGRGRALSRHGSMKLEPACPWCLSQVQKRRVKGLPGGAGISPSKHRVAVRLSVLVQRALGFHIYIRIYLGAVHHFIFQGLGSRGPRNLFLPYLGLVCVDPWELTQPL